MKTANPLLALILGVCLPLAGHAAAYEVYLTARAHSGVPLREPAGTFSCDDKIYAVLEVNLADSGSGPRTLRATWRNPYGEDQEITEYPFQITNGNARVWVWLKLHRSGEAAIVQFLNPSAGKEEFVGQWELRMQVDEREVAKKSFEVVC